MNSIALNLDGALRRIERPASPEVLNFRALAGLVADGGRRIRPGRLFRSGHVPHLTASDAEALHGLGLTSVCDLRSADEQRREPSALAGAGFVQAMPAPAGDPTVALRVVGDPNATPADVRAAMLSTYAAMPKTFGTALREVFDAALTSRGGLLVQCAIGKDRTGAAIALLLAAVGVPRAAITADYAASNFAYDAIFAAMCARNPNRAPPPDAMVRPLLAADPTYLAAFWDRIDTDWGGVEGYLASLGLGPDAIGCLRARWLEWGVH